MHLSNRTYSTVISLLLAFAGIALFIARMFPIGVTQLDVITAAMVLIGFMGAFFSIGTIRKGAIFVSSVLFLTGVALITAQHIEIISARQMVFPSAFIIAGLSFLMLFIDEPKNLAFLISSLFMLASGLALVYFRKSFGAISFTNDLGYSLMKFWPVYILIAGSVYLLRKKI